eukprot:COSAG01_NODE_2847_length_6983_cov_7.853574_2_plen_87_part_00
MPRQLLLSNLGWKRPDGVGGSAACLPRWLAAIASSPPPGPSALPGGLSPAALRCWLCLALDGVHITVAGSQTHMQEGEPPMGNGSR